VRKRVDCRDDIAIGVVKRAVGVSLRIDVVDDIPREPNGKFRPYRCYLKIMESYQISL